MNGKTKDKTITAILDANRRLREENKELVDKLKKYEPDPVVCGVTESELRGLSAAAAKAAGLK
ncbi:MAG TPA: hypothetical protein DCY07_00290 [Rhodospirillaceae bacterium]|nr:hypothetical protein [Rhodospirillaceae bacterium]